MRRGATPSKASQHLDTCYHHPHKDQQPKSDFRGCTPSQRSQHDHGLKCFQNCCLVRTKRGASSIRADLEGVTKRRLFSFACQYTVPLHCQTGYRTATSHPFLSQGPLDGALSNGGVSRSGLVLPFLSFFVLFRTFPIFLGFSRFARGWSGDFPDLSFSSFSAY